jgi:hypothetical protein
MATIWMSADSPPAYPDEPFMYPVRLWTSNHESFQLYAYPTPRPQNTLIQLETPIPAIVSYVLGSTWRSQLSPLGTLRVPQTNWTNDDETAVAFRMLRGAGAIMDTSFANGQWWRFDDGFGPRWRPVQRRKKYIFGWPDGGGVWVLHLPPLVDRSNQDEDEQLIEEFEQHRNWDKIKDDVFRDFDGSVHYGDLVECETMEQLCKKLEEKGARYYEDIGESAEVREEMLVDVADAMKKEPV